MSLSQVLEKSAAANRLSSQPGGLFWPILLVALLAFLVAGCRCSGTKSSETASLVLQPLQARSWAVWLQVPGFGRARVAVPLGARSARPLVIALHGDADRPEWPCGSYHHAGSQRGIVLCPDGEAHPGGVLRGLGTPRRTSQELRAALPALKGRFEKHLAKGPAVLAALGPSVDHAIDIARQEPSFFSYLVLVDGSLARLTPPITTRYAAAGGKRVLIVCTRAGCDPEVARKVLALRSAGVDARVLRVPGAFGLDGKATRAIRGEWDWLVRGDARW